MSQHHARLSGGARQKRNRRIFAEKGDVCHICGHPGSDAIDHVMPIAKGGSDDDDNLMPAHHDTPCPTCGRKCNRIKGDKLMSDIDRKVVMICGPPGAGKTTLAHTLGLEVYDLDDEKWNHNDALFKAHLVQVREDPKAQAVVIRTGATISARRKGAANCGATEVIILDTPLAVCIERIKARDRQEPPIRIQIYGAREWWAKYQPGDVPMAMANMRTRRSGSLARP